jgi:long-subunit acyl-CoA synthetase (AMP-forming)
MLRQYIPIVRSTLSEGLLHGSPPPNYSYGHYSKLDADFVVGGELTLSMKVEREGIAEKYNADIEAVYAEKKIA